jgi:hypothetical protein
MVCSNNKKKVNGKTTHYKCMGHEDGDYFYPSFHGKLDENNSHIFFVYPKNKKILDPEC